MPFKRRHDSDDESAVVKKLNIGSEEHSSDLESDLENATEELHLGYLKTINRSRLDFDFEKVCCISLATVNIYACLVCGKYYQGRSKSSCAFSHSLDEDHHVFINLDTLKVYILPENQEVKLRSEVLEDIKYQINPTFSPEDIKNLHQLKEISFDLQHRPYRPGFVGLNKIGANDYANVVLQIVNHVDALRDFLLKGEFEEELTKRISLMTRKSWSSRLSRPHLSPHEIMQYISDKSGKRFSAGEQKSPKDFLVWILTNLHSELTPKGKTRSLVSKLFQGKVKIITEKVANGVPTGSRLESSTKYWILTIDPPAFTLFKDGTGLTQIPQVKITHLLSKYDGETAQKLAHGNKMFKLITVPPFLLIHINRMSGSHGLEGVSGTSRNPTIVKFPFENLDMSPYVEGATGPIQYKLIGNVIHQTIPVTKMVDGTEMAIDSHVYKIHLLDQVRGDWLEIQDLNVKPVEKELLFMQETYLQIWQKVL
ncbi:unnamed protein product [Kuraishia capsulata CBS 1993]|uniref:Uncharacterized protein n=1 Tax=Kuraishia capsulata CBS 1993 TaxID=1382522 RepID=W6MNT6_9ASCO|nr:uncharacterized protein KUCA_T00002696001 [Kuraishia capsulata CBS 1993]CDK26722.1 unnamed protein product [Kuraishia capsulata CBS 1993]